MPGQRSPFSFSTQLFLRKQRISLGVTSILSMCSTSHSIFTSYKKVLPARFYFLILLLFMCLGLLRINLSTTSPWFLTLCISNNSKPRRKHFYSLDHWAFQFSVFYNSIYMGSRTTAHEENCPTSPKLTLVKTLTLTMGQFSSGKIVLWPPTLKLTVTLTETLTLTGGQFSSGSDCPDTIYDLILGQSI